MKMLALHTLIIGIILCAQHVVVSVAGEEVDATTTAGSTSTTAPTTQTSNTAIIIVAVVIPVLVIIAAVIIIWLIYKKRIHSRDSGDITANVGLVAPQYRRPHRVHRMKFSGLVTGVAVSCNRLFTVDGGSSISVFDVTLKYKKIKDIQLDQLIERGEEGELLSLTDIVTSDSTLLACDWMNKRIIRLNSSSLDSSVELFIKLDCRPFTMSVLSQRLLVTPGQGSERDQEPVQDSLFLYDLENKQLVKRVPLASHVTTWHAVETQRATFVVCQTGRGVERETQHNEVAELDGEGRVLRVFGGLRGDGPHLLNWPHYLSLDVDGRVLVADSDNRRILLLDSELQPERVLLSASDKLDSKPYNMHFSQETGQLAVAHNGLPGSVTVYCDVLTRT